MFMQSPILLTWVFHNQLIDSVCGKPIPEATIIGKHFRIPEYTHNTQTWKEA